MKKKTLILLIVFSCVAGIFLFLYLFERPYKNTISPDLKFGFLPADDTEYYKEFKSLGIDYVLIGSYSEEDAMRRLSEAEKNGLMVYISAGTLHPDDFMRMEKFGGNKVVEGFFLDEPHVHKANYKNTDIEKWITWSKEKFPDKKIFIATPRTGTYEELLNIPNLKEIGFQPDTYPIMGPLKIYGTQRRLVERMQNDGFEIQPIVQTHARLLYEEGMKGKYVDIISSIGGHGLIDWPTPQQVAMQIKNVAVSGVKLIWFYPGQDIFIKWTPERAEYIKNIFEELKK
ncbi:MAG: hypothetical protein AB1333_00620 [Patescibacteria group bacterium]